MLTKPIRSLLPIANFLVGLAMFAVIATLTKQQLPELGGVARFLPMLLGSTISYPLIVLVRATNRIMVFRWITVCALPMLGMAYVLDRSANAQWLLLIALAQLMSTLQSTRSLRSDFAEGTGPHGDLFLIWADLGYGIGTATGILLWASDLGAMGDFQAALIFSAIAMAVAFALDFFVVYMLLPHEETASTQVQDAYFDGDAHTWNVSRAKWVLARWSAIVPLLALKQANAYWDFLRNRLENPRSSVFCGV